MSAPAEQLHVCIPEYALGYAYCEDMAQLSNSNSRQKVRAGSNCMCANQSIVVRLVSLAFNMDSLDLLEYNEKARVSK